MLRRILVLCVWAGAIVGLPSARAELQVGAATRIITPNPLLPVSGGMGIPQPAKEKRGELTARRHRLSERGGLGRRRGT